MNKMEVLLILSLTITAAIVIVEGWYAISDYRNMLTRIIRLENDVRGIVDLITTSHDSVELDELDSLVRYGDANREFYQECGLYTPRDWR